MTPADPTSAAWVRTTTTAIARGDRAALAALYGCWFDHCYGHARSLTGRDESFCLDVVQETMLRVIRSLKPLGSHEELAAWLSRATQSAAIDMLRRESRRLRREVARGVAGSKVSLRETDDRISSMLTRIRDMPDGSLIALRLGHEQSLEAIGAATGVSGDAAHGRIRRAMSKLARWAREIDREP